MCFTSLVRTSTRNVHVLRRVMKYAILPNSSFIDTSELASKSALINIPHWNLIL
jgi:hypothetical protein